MQSGTCNVVTSLVAWQSWFWFHGRSKFMVFGFTAVVLVSKFKVLWCGCCHRCTHLFDLNVIHSSHPLRITHFTLSFPRLNDDEDHALHIEGEDLFLPQHFFHTLNANAAIKALSETNRLQEAVDTFKSRGR